MEFVSGGKLQTYLRESRAERLYGNLHGSSKHLTSRDLTTFSYQIAKGMDYLANKGVRHLYFNQKHDNSINMSLNFSKFL